jgi:hypothetical protein
MPSPCTVTGNLIQLSNGIIAQGTVIFELANLGTGNPITVSGTGIFPALRYIVQSTAAGAFTQALWGNDNISPSNTIYSVTYRDTYGNEVGPVLYSITGGSANLNTLAAVSSTIPPVLAPSGGSSILLISSKSASFAVSMSTLYLVTTGASVITATLPTAVGIGGQFAIIKKVDSGAGSVSVATTSGQTIDGGSTYSLVNQWQFVEVCSDGANWQIIGNN